VPKDSDVPGAAAYSGVVMHSSRYANGREFAGKRVLVVGLGNTGAEIAADLVESGAGFVAVSIRATPPIVPRDFLGTPVQLFGIALSRCPARLADRIGAILARVALGDLTRYGLKRPEWLPFSARRIPVIDVGFVKSLKHGNVALRPATESFTQNGVRFSDGTEEPYDAVILATGYRTGLENVLEVPDVLDANGYPKYASGERTSTRGLYFMGFFESHRGLLFETEIASRRLAKIIAHDVAASAQGATV
jgi:cation diffusion facilitator CzcD-associated flavoprotein CzcO